MRLVVVQLASGQLLAGYRVERLLGRGGMGVVYQATQLSLKRTVALKLLSPELQQDESFRARFQQEAQLLASLEHPHVLPIHEAGETAGLLFLAMRYVEGSDLQSELDQGALAPERAVRIVAQLGSALQAAHERGLVHRDVKPANVLLTGKDEEEHVYLTDFGLARSLEGRGLTRTGEFLGSLDYLAPEQIEHGHADARSDVYALGCLLYACLTGSPPFAREQEAATLWAHLNAEPPSASDLRPEVPVVLDSVIATALAKDPEQRYQTAAELAHALDEALAGKAPAAARKRKRRAKPKTNLPVSATAFVGRERELAEVRGMLLRDDVRLLTLTGPGGSGKTRLAIAAAAELLDEFEHGVYFIGLAALREPTLVFESAAQVLGTKDTLASHVGSKRMLLLFDNFEHLVEAAPALGELLAAAPNLKLLVTSREPLHLSGERVYSVLPLTETDAVALFTARAVATRSDFAPDGELADVCRALDGLPLAIELAAARVTVLSPAGILERLQKRLPLLTGGPRDAPERQRTLRATIEWSYELLAPIEHVLFARLAVFAGGFSLAAAEAICDADLDTLASLVDKSLLRSGDERFRMLQTVREYAYEQLGRRGEVAELERRHADYFLTLAEQAEPETRGPEQELWLDRLSAETDNLRAAFSWSLVQGEIELGLRLAIALGTMYGFWQGRGHLSEGRTWLSELLDRSDDVQPLVRARGLWTIAELAFSQGDYRFAEQTSGRSLALFRELDNRRGIALSLALHGVLATYSLGDYQRARRLGEEGVALARELGDQRVLARALNDLAITLEAGGQLSEAAALREECLALRRQSRDQYAIAGSLNNIGCTAGLRGDYAQARGMLNEALTLLPSDDKLLRAYVLGNLGWVELLDGDLVRAASALSESIALFTEVGDQRGLAENLCAFAGVAAAQEQAIRAARLWGAAEVAVEAVDGGPLQPSERAIEERYVRATRDELGEAEWSKQLAAGRALTLEQAVDYALEPVLSAAESM